jgi:MerR family transcriptional regulator, thiopeptide resistance regulator
LWDRTLEMTMLDTAVTNTTTLLVYDDLEAVHEYLVRVFGLTARGGALAAVR